MKRAALALLIVAPAVLAFAFIATYGVTVPHDDEWAYIGWYLAGAPLRGLWAEHNEHRIVVGRLVLLALDHLTHMDQRAAMFASWASLCAAAALLSLELRSRLWLYVPLAWLVFSLRQIDNLLWGWQLHMCLCMALIVAALVTLQGRLAVSLAAGAAATFTLSSGLLVWPAGLVHLLLSRAPRRAVAIWSAAGAACIALYFAGWARPHEALAPGDVVAYFLAALGNPFAANLLRAQLFGVALLALCVVAAALAVRDARVRASLGVPLVAFAVAHAAVLAVTRSGFGAEQALVARYSTFALLLPAGLYLIFCAAGQRWLVALMCVVFALWLPAIELRVWREGASVRSQRLIEAARLRAYDVLPGVGKALQAPPQLVHALRARRLSLFRHDPPVPAHPGGRATGTLDAPSVGDVLRLTGTARDAAAVWAIFDARLGVPGAVGLEGDRFQLEAVLPPGRHSFVVRLVDRDGGFTDAGSGAVDVR